MARIYVSPLPSYVHYSYMDKHSLSYCDFSFFACSRLDMAFSLFLIKRKRQWILTSNKAFLVITVVIVVIITLLYYHHVVVTSIYRNHLEIHNECARQIRVYWYTEILPFMEKNSHTKGTICMGIGVGCSGCVGLAFAMRELRRGNVCRYIWG